MSIIKLQGDSFPFFPIREYEALEHVGPITYIQTYYSRYILDNKSLSGDYVERRLKISAQGADEKLYPIKYICNTLPEVYNSGAKLFIDSTGKIIKWVKTAFHYVHCLTVLQVVELNTGKFELWYRLPDGGIEKINTRDIYKYIYAIRLGPMCYMPIDFGNTLEPICRRKL